MDKKVLNINYNLQKTRLYNSVIKSRVCSRLNIPLMQNFSKDDFHVVFRYLCKENYFWLFDLLCYSFLVLSLIKMFLFVYKIIMISILEVTDLVGIQEVVYVCHVSKNMTCYFMGNIIKPKVFSSAAFS